MTSTKIIFLDFDGPLSNERVTLAYGDNQSMDPVACRALNHICEDSGAKIVCTSTRAVKGNDGDYKEAMLYFNQAGLDIRHIHPDWSCNPGNHIPRHRAISEWLSHHPEITQYVIIDDESVADEKDAEYPNMLKVSMTDGIGSGTFRSMENRLGMNISKVFLAAQTDHKNAGQLRLAFDQWDAGANADIILKTQQKPEINQKDWNLWCAEIDHNFLEDGKLRLVFRFPGSKLRGNLFVAPKDIYISNQSNFYIRNGAPVAITPI